MSAECVKSLIYLKLIAFIILLMPASPKARAREPQRRFQVSRQNEKKFLKVRTVHVYTVVALMP